MLLCVSFAHGSLKVYNDLNVTGNTLIAGNLFTGTDTRGHTNLINESGDVVFG